MAYTKKKPLLPDGLKKCCKCQKVTEKHSFFKEKGRYDGLNPMCKSCCAEKQQLRYKTNKKRLNSNSAAYKKKRRREDPAYRAIAQCRSRIQGFFRCSGIGKNRSGKALLGVESKEQLKQHLEAQFKPGMTWENYGEWHIDHKLPLSLILSGTHGYELFHYKNLQPLWAQDNLRKSDKVEQDG